MLIDAVSAAENSQDSTITERATASFLAFIERRLGVRVVRDVRDFPESVALSKPLALAKLLKEKGLLKNFHRNNQLPDEPRIHYWSAYCNDKTSHRTGGASWSSNSDALYAALAEVVERYIWFMKEDYFIDPTRATFSEIQKKGLALNPADFSGYTDAQRSGNPKRHFDINTKFTWIQGRSLVLDAPTYVPAQVVSGIRIPFSKRAKEEPLIRPIITNGLATWPSLSGARCAGANEILEREAYMVMWLNQLTLPRYSLTSLRKLDPALAKLIDSCERYRLKMHVIKMPTDAPTHAIAVIFEDESGIVPRFTIGIRAHRSLTKCIEKAAAETFRAFRAHRLWSREGNVWDTKTPASAVGHRERLYYWGAPENSPRLEFLIAGPEIEAQLSLWDTDDEEQHLARIVNWCAEKKIDCVSVSLGHSPTNPTPFHIEMVVMPQLQWTHLFENDQAFGGKRWKELPTILGYTPRSEPFADEPHPFS